MTSPLLTVRFASVLVLAMMVLVQTASAGRIAVLPLEKGAGGADFDGLGLALAGMVITDLSGVEGLDLVERARMDALLDEIELSKTDFVDPETAVRLGRGLGAESIVVGSYSVVNDQFLMDLRLVDAGSGRVRSAFDGQGTVDDFVAVEKEVVEPLIEALEVQLDSATRRRLYVQTPTERFDALQAYGEGLGHRLRGKRDDAEDAFGRALELDPAFAEARAALQGVRELLEQREEAEESEEQRIVRAFTENALKLPPPRPNPEPMTRDEQTALLVRWLGLAFEGRWCDRKDEMLAVMEQNAGRIERGPFVPPTGEPAPTYPPGFELAFYTRLKETNGGENLPSDVVRRGGIDLGDTAHLFTSVAHLSYGVSARHYSWHRFDGVAGAIVKCHPNDFPTQRRALEDLESILSSAGVLDTLYGRGKYTTRDVADKVWLELVTRRMPPTAEVEQRIRGLLERHPDDRTTELLVKQLSQVLDKEAAKRLKRLGRPRAWTTSHLVALRDRDTGVLDLSSPVCAYIADTEAENAENAIRDWQRRQRKTPDVQEAFDDAMAWHDIAPVHALLDYGCIRGERRRFDSPAAVIAHLESAIDPTRPSEQRDRDRCEDLLRDDLPDVTETLEDLDERGQPFQLAVRLTSLSRQAIVNECEPSPW